MPDHDDLLGQALLDYMNGDLTAALVSHCSDGEILDMPAALFFREAGQFPPVEQRAIALCRGTVLDAGAGAGCHSLALQELGHEVIAVDISAAAVDIMRRRGVRQALLADVLQLDIAPVDTVLLMMNGIGVVGSLPRLAQFLWRAHRLVRAGGQLLLDSLDIRGYREGFDDRAPDTYPGAVRYRWEYRGQFSPEFPWLYVDPITLSEYAVRCGWRCSEVVIQDDGDYLAQLERPGARGGFHPARASAGRGPVR